VHDATVPSLKQLAEELSKAGFLVMGERVIVADDWRRRPVATTDRCIHDVLRGVPVGTVVKKCCRVAAMYQNLDQIRAFGKRGDGGMYVHA
jgi:hypothetical protein